MNIVVLTKRRGPWLKIVVREAETKTVYLKVIATQAVSEACLLKVLDDLQPMKVTYVDNLLSANAKR
jgi:transposase-like protein